jgi:hypothetical protein
MRWQIYFS